MIFNYIIGPAGSGKSTLTAALYEHISGRYNEISVITVNLDPGVSVLPYNPHVDVRDYITLEEVMEKYGLGPNGGLIAATDMIIDYLEDIKYEISQFNDPELVIIDTPGQMELFAFRVTGPTVASSLGFGDARKIITFLFDPFISRHPNGFISTMLLAASVHYRFLNIPQIHVLTKIDTVEESVVDRIIEWSTDHYKLEEDTDRSERGLIREMSLLLTNVFRELGSLPTLTAVSAHNNYGMDDYWGYLQRVTNFDESPFY